MGNQHFNVTLPAKYKQAVSSNQIVIIIKTDI